MHAVTPLIFDLTIIFGIAGVVMLICLQFKQPLVLGYLIAGIIIGPFTPPYILVSDVASIKVVAEIGVIFLMFSIGLDFSFHKLKRMGRPALIISFVEVLCMLALGFALGRILKWTVIESLFLGAALSISSTTIIIKALTELKLKNTPFAELILGVLVVEDLFAIILLIGLPLLAISGGSEVGSTVMYAILKLVLVVSSWFLIGYFIVPTIFKRWISSTSDEVLIVISVALCFGMVCLAEHFHYSEALGAFIMGSILAETEESERIEHLIQPLRDIYAAVFFVTIGMLIDPVEIWHHFGEIVLITLVTIVGKVAACFCGAYFSRRKPSLSLQVGLGMAQIGEFSFIITALGVSLNFLNVSFYPIIVAVSVITTFTTPYFIRASVKLAHYMEQHETTKNISHTVNRHEEVVSRKNTSQALIAYIINMIIVAIIFSLMGYVLPLAGHSTQDIILTNLIFGGFYLGAGPFIRMALMIPFHASSFLLKVLGIILTCMELYFLTRHAFSSFMNLTIWLMLILVFSIVFQKQWERIYTWMASHLYGNLKQER